jgi:glutamate synthase (NADPH/NADH) small chain
VERPRLSRPLAEALDRLHKTNNFPEFTGRVCPAPCEGSCVLGINNPPVTIKNIEARSSTAAGKKAGCSRAAEGAHRQEGRRDRLRPRRPRRRRAAQPRRPHRHRASSAPTAGRPAHVRHPEHEARQAEIVERRIKLMEQEGIKFICNANVGDNVEADLLLKDFDATVICTGATQPRDLPIEGPQL